MIMKKVDWRVATLFIQKRHYSAVMPKLTKHWLGCYEDEKLVGVLTLGWGTNPMGTIKKMFPDLTTSDYYEIGKMCMDESMLQMQNIFTHGQMVLLVSLDMFINLQISCLVVLFGVMCIFLQLEKKFISELFKEK
jgi:hypothetical protein